MKVYYSSRYFRNQLIFLFVTLLPSYQLIVAALLIHYGKQMTKQTTQVNFFYIESVQSRGKHVLQCYQVRNMGNMPAGSSLTCWKHHSIANEWWCRCVAHFIKQTSPFVILQLWSALVWFSSQDQRQRWDWDVHTSRVWVKC